MPFSTLLSFMDPKVVVMVISNRDMWYADFSWSLVDLVRTNMGRSVIDVGFIGGQTIAQMRNRAVHAVRGKKDATHIMMLDDDQVYPPDCIDRLLAHDVPVIGGLYPARRSPWYLNVHMRFGEKDDSPYAANRVFNMPIEGLVKTGVLGLGGAIINMEVFDKLESPYFDSPTRAEAMPEYVEHGEYDIIGDEFYFAKKCKDADIPIYVDTTVRYVHKASMGVVFHPNTGVKYVTPKQ